LVHSKWGRLIMATEGEHMCPIAFWYQLTQDVLDKWL